MHKLTYLFHYLTLGLVLSAGLFLLLMYRAHPQSQFYISLGLALSYFFWGITHHYLTDDLHKKHVVEYGLIAVLGIILVQLVLL